jgi:hypothetical protein
MPFRKVAMDERKSWLGRGCLALALLVMTPFLVVAIIALAGIGIGAFTMSLPFLFLLGVIALGVAAITLLVTFVIRMIVSRRGRNEIRPGTQSVDYPGG